MYVYVHILTSDMTLKPSSNVIFLMHALQKAVLVFLHISVCSPRSEKWLEPTFFYYYLYIMHSKCFWTEYITWIFFFPIY